MKTLMLNQKLKNISIPQRKIGAPQAIKQESRHD
jgi:hypothetical protein